jgi:selenocysteine-specific elongation factor
LGGGWIIFHSSKNRQRYSEKSIEALSVGEHGNLEALVMDVLNKEGKVLSGDDIWRVIFEDKKEIADILVRNSGSGDVIWLKETNKYLSKALYRKFIENITNEFKVLKRKYPFRYQIDREEIKSRVFGVVDVKDFAAIINKILDDRVFELDGKFVVQADKIDIKRISLMKETMQVEKAFYQDGLNIRNIGKLKQDLNIDAAQIEEIVKFLVKTDKLIDIGNNILIHKDILIQTANRIREILDRQGNATTAQVRDHLNVGRKLAIDILTFLDNCEITQRIDDFRKPGVRYMDYYV